MWWSIVHHCLSEFSNIERTDGHRSALEDGPRTGPRMAPFGYPPNSMSRLGPDTSTTPQSGSTMALMHWVDGAWSGIRYTPTPTGIAIHEAVRLDESQAEAWRDQRDTASRFVVPASAVICRTMSLGRGDEAAQDHELHNTMAERLGDAAPLHRQAATLLTTDKLDAERVGVGLAWPPRQSIRIPAGVDEMTLAVPDIAGLLSLLGTHRPNQPILWHDPADGSTAIVLAGGERVAIRSTRITDLSSAETRQRFVLESAIQAGWSADDAATLTADMPQPAAGIQLSLPSQIEADMRQRCGDTMPDDMARFGVVVACALATADDYAPLTVLRATLPNHEPSFGERVTESLSKTQVAIKLAIALVLVLIFGPLLSNGVRYALLSMSHGDLGMAVSSAATAEQRNRLYAQLGAGSLPVTKLLADISAATPLGVKIDSIKMGAGEPVRITGDATTYDGVAAAELIGLMKSHMQTSRVFKDVTVEWGGQSNLGERSFSLNASIGQTSLRPSYAAELDFAAWTHQQRRYSLPTTAEGGPDPRPSIAGTWKPGEAGGSVPSADNGQASSNATHTTTRPSGNDPLAASGSSTPQTTAPAARPRPSQPVSTTPPSTVPRRTSPLAGGTRPDRGGGDFSARDTDSQSVAGEGARSGDLSAEDMGAMPEILTDEQIATLNKPETLAKVKEVSAARSRVTNVDVEAELTAYWKRLFAHLRTFQTTGGSP